MIKWKYRPAGACPVQAEGYFLGYYFYFRSRWDKATIEFSKTEADWENDRIHARYTLWTSDNPYAMGWFPHDRCRMLIWMGCARFLFKINKSKLVKDEE